MREPAISASHVSIARLRRRNQRGAVHFPIGPSYTTIVEEYRRPRHFAVTERTLRDTARPPERLIFVSPAQDTLEKGTIPLDRGPLPVELQPPRAAELFSAAGLARAAVNQVGEHSSRPWTLIVHSLGAPM